MNSSGHKKNSWQRRVFVLTLILKRKLGKFGKRGQFFPATFLSFVRHFVVDSS